MKLDPNGLKELFKLWKGLLLLILLIVAPISLLITFFGIAGYFIYLGLAVFGGLSYTVYAEGKRKGKTS